MITEILLTSLRSITQGKPAPMEVFPVRSVRRETRTTVRWQSINWSRVRPIILISSLLRDFLLLSKEVTEALKLAGYLPDVNGSTRTETPSPESPVAGPSDPDSEEERYRRALSPLQYEGIEFASKICPADNPGY